MEKTKKTSAIKVKRKMWFTILAPELFSNVVVGETSATEPEEVMGKCVSMNLANITRSLKQQSINVKFKVVSVKERTANTDIVAYEMMPAAIKRMMRRNVDRIDDSFIAATSDGMFVRIKPWLLTRSNTTSSVRNAIRRAMREYILQNVEKMTYQAVVRDIVSYKLQNSLQEKISKIYPTKIVAIKMFTLVDPAKAKKVEKSTGEEIVPQKEEGTEEAGAEETSAEEDLPTFGKHKKGNDTQSEEEADDADALDVNEVEDAETNY